MPVVSLIAENKLKKVVPLDSSALEMMVVKKMEGSDVLKKLGISRAELGKRLREELLAFRSRQRAIG